MYMEGGGMLSVPERRRRSAGGADETRRELSWFVDTVVSSDSTKTAAPRRTSQRAERAIRQSERSERSNQNRIAPPAVLSRSEQTRFLSASDDEVGGLHGAIRAERAQRVEQSKWST
jgi:hypothetical protein